VRPQTGFPFPGSLSDFWFPIQDAFPQVARGSGPAWFNAIRTPSLLPVFLARPLENLEDYKSKQPG
jgi:hypothetical protein